MIFEFLIFHILSFIIRNDRIIKNQDKKFRIKGQGPWSVESCLGYGRRENRVKEASRCIESKGQRIPLCRRGLIPRERNLRLLW